MKKTLVYILSFLLIFNGIFISFGDVLGIDKAIEEKDEDAIEKVELAKEEVISRETAEKTEESKEESISSEAEEVGALPTSGEAEEKIEEAGASSTSGEAGEKTEEVEASLTSGEAGEKTEEVEASPTSGEAGEKTEEVEASSTSGEAEEKTEEVGASSTSGEAEEKTEKVEASSTSGEAEEKTEKVEASSTSGEAEEKTEEAEASSTSGEAEEKTEKVEASSTSGEAEEKTEKVEASSRSGEIEGKTEEVTEETSSIEGEKSVSPETLALAKTSETSEASKGSVDKISLNIDSAVTGIASFDDIDMDGNDSSADNDIIRSLDFIKFVISYGVVNELDTAENAIMKCTIMDGKKSGEKVARWDENLANTSPDLTIEDNQLIINLNQIKGGYAKKIEIMLQAMSNAEDGEKFDVKIELISDNFATKEVLSREITITSKPNADIVLKKYRVLDTVEGPDGKLGKLIYFGVAINIKNGVGAELLKDEITFKADIKNLGVNNGLLYSENSRSACDINGIKGGESIRFLPFGKIINDKNKEKSVSNSGSIVAKQSAKGEDIEFTISGLDSSALHAPTKAINGKAIANDDKAIFAGYFKLFIADEDLKVGQNKIKTVLYDFNAKGISGNVNTADTLSNNSDEFDVFKHDGSYGNGTLSGRIDYHKNMKLEKIDTMSGWSAGDGTIVAGQNFVSKTGMSIGKIEDLEEIVILNKFDTSVMELENIDGKDKPYLSRIVDKKWNVEEYPSNWDVEFGILDFADYNDMAKSNGESGKWFSTLEEAKASALGEVSMVKMSLKPGTFLSSEYRPQLILNFKAKNNSNVGDLVPIFLTYKAKNARKGSWSTSSYRPTTNRYAGSGQRLTITKAKARIEKVEINDVKGMTIDSLDSKSLSYKLNMTFTTDPRLTGGSLIDGDLKIRDIIKPATVKYVDGSSNYEPKSVKVYDDRTEIVWDLKDVKLNDPVESIKYDLEVLPDTLSKIENVVIIESDLDGSVESKRKSSWDISVINTNAWAIREELIIPEVEINDGFGYEVYYSNFDTRDLTGFKFISVLPNEDNSNFKGTYKLKNLQGSNNEVFYITKDKFDASSISSKSGFDTVINTLTWEKFDNSNPDHLEGVYAVRYDVSKLDGKAVGQKVTYTFQPSDNFEGDSYSNKTRGVTETIPNVIVSSKMVTTKVIQGLIGQYLWIDENNDKIKNTEEKGFPNISVKLQKYDSLSGSYFDIESAVTDDKGYYEFDHLHSGKYKVLVDESQLGDYKLSKDPDGLADNIHEIDLKVDEDYLNANFGYYKEKIVIVNKGSIGNYIWIDSNKDGIKDSSEDGIKNTRITLEVLNTVSGNFENYGVTTTDDSGNYKFSDLATGKYKVLVDHSNLSGYKMTKDPDSKADGIHEVDLGKDQEYGLANFAYIKEESKSSTPSSSSSDKKKKKRKKSKDSDDDYVRQEEEEEELFDIFEEEIPLGETTIEKGKIIIYHLEDESKKILYPTEERLGVLDTKYETKYKEFDGYRLVEVPENYKGAYDKKTKTIVYYYTKIDSEVVEETVELVKLPETGESDIDLSYYLGLLMIMIGSIMLLWMRKSESTQ